MGIKENQNWMFHECNCYKVATILNLVNEFGTYLMFYINLYLPIIQCIAYVPFVLKLCHLFYYRITFLLPNVGHFNSWVSD